MSYDAVDPRGIRMFPLAGRRNLLRLAEEVGRAVSAGTPEEPVREQIRRLAERIRHARRHQAAVMLTYGAHLIKNGAGPMLNCLIEAGWLTHLATQGEASSMIGSLLTRPPPANRSGKTPRLAPSAPGRKLAGG